MPMRWYVIQAYSGFEKGVLKSLTERIDRAGMHHMFGQILVPTEEVVENRKGTKVLTEQKFFPGYVLVEMDMSDETWHLVKSTPKVMGFVGGKGMKPTPVPQPEVDKVLRQIQEGIEKPKPKVLFEVGETLRVNEGPFADFNATVEEINYDKNKLHVSVLIFGRPTRVEVSFAQVEKV